MLQLHRVQRAQLLNVLQTDIDGRLEGNVKVSFIVDTPLPTDHCFPQVNDYNV